MADFRGFDFLDILIVIVKRKKFFIILFIVSIIISYFSIYFLITPQYDSTAMIVATEESQGNLISSITSKFSKLPLNALGFGTNNALEKYDLFTTIIYSRTNLEDMIYKFELKNDYEIESTEKMVKFLKDLIEVDITDESAYTIKVRAISPEKSAEMTNYLLQKVNNAVIDLNTKKARENRIFLEDRYKELMVNVTKSEDSLKVFQEKSGMIEAENQTKSIMDAYAKLESDLAVKQIQLAVTEKLIGKNSPQAENLRTTVEEFKNRINNYASGKENDNIILPLNKLPNNVMQYYRYFRDVEIYNAMLEFVVPLYEQARFEEVNAVPVLQIIDKAVPPEKKSYPPRVLFTILITFFVMSIAAIVIIFKRWVNLTVNEKVKIILKEIKHFRKNPSKL